MARKAMSIKQLLGRLFGRKVRDQRNQTAISPSKSAFRVQARQTFKTVNIGIDFGTSSSKVTFRDIDTGRSFLIPIRPGARGCEKYLFPTTVAEENGRLEFGVIDSMPRKSIFRAFKICLACGTGRFSNPRCDAQFRGCSRNPGYLSLSDGGTVAAAHLTSLYLGHLMRTAEKVVQRHFGPSTVPALTFNSAVPLEYLERGATRSAFERAVFVAHAIRSQVHQGMRLDDALNLCETEFRRLTTLPDEALRSSFVLAESLAGVISYINSPKALDGFHSIVDIGAGTTDISFFKRWTVAGETKIAFYHCDDHVVGGDNLDHALARHLGNTHPSIPDTQLVTVARSAKESAVDGSILFDLGKTQMPLEQAEYEAVVNPICDELAARCQRTWRKAYEKEKVQGAWRSYNVFVVGGSSRFSGFRQAALRKPWEHIGEIVPLEPVLPEDFQTLDADPKTLKENAHLFAVAYGVSRHYAEWPEFYRPLEVDPWEIPRPRLVPTWEQNLNQD